MREILYLLSKYQLVLALSYARICAAVQDNMPVPVLAQGQVCSNVKFGIVSYVRAEFLHLCSVKLYFEFSVLKQRLSTFLYFQNRCRIFGCSS